MKKRLVTVFLLITLVSLFIFPVSANSPGPWSEFTVEILNAPEDVYYIDILMLLSPDDDMYSDNLKYLPEPSWESSPIYTYNKDGYVSHSFHYRHARRLAPPTDGIKSFSHHTSTWSSIKIVALDQNGNIVKETEAFYTDPPLFLTVSQGYVQYDYLKNEVKVETELNIGALYAYLIVSIIGVLLTASLEWLFAFCFRTILLYTKCVFVTNLITQMVMRILFALLYSFVWPSYIFWTILLEILVYVSEYLIYRKFMFVVERKTILIFTIAANTITLFIGLGINYLFMI